MEKKKFNKYFLLLIGLLISVSSFSQTDPMFTLYFQNMQIFNPAYAGSWKAIGFTAVNRLQWLGIQGHPSTQTFSVQAPINSERVGLGFNLIHDRIGMEKRLTVNLDYSYRIRLTQNSSLRLGIKGGFINYSNPLPFYTTYDPGDPNYLLDINSKFLPNIGIGAYLSTPRSYLGVSVPKLIESKYSTASNEHYTIQDYREFYASGGTVFDIIEDVKFKPSFIVKVAEGSPFQFDVSANFLFKEKFWLGTMYRSGDAAGIIAQWIFNQKLRIGYAYDFTTTDLRYYQKGVHEVMISYELKYSRHRYVSPRYF